MSAGKPAIGRYDNGIDASGRYSDARRSGDLDPAVVLQMLRRHGSETVQRHLYHDSGLLALSDGISADMRSLTT